MMSSALGDFDYLTKRDPVRYKPGFDNSGRPLTTVSNRDDCD